MKFVRKINKRSKYSYTISIPKELIKEFGWKERQKLSLIPHRRKKSIEIKDWPVCRPALRAKRDERNRKKKPKR